MRARNFLQHKWHAITIILTVIAIACAALVILRGMPPHRIIMATGLEGGSYYEVGQRYRAALARESVQVELRLTSGSAENLALLMPQCSRRSSRTQSNRRSREAIVSAMRLDARNCAVSRCLQVRDVRFAVSQASHG
jgi:hypothetical protein